MTWYDRYYKEKGIYEAFISVPIIQNVYNHTELILFIYFLFFWGGVEMHSLLWGLSFGEGLVWGNSTFNLYSIKTIMPMEIPRVTYVGRNSTGSTSHQKGGS